MKIKLLIILILVFFLIIGCGTVTSSYSFAENESRTAKLEFQHGIKGVFLVDFEGQLPGDEYNWTLTYITVPAERTMNIRVYVFWDGKGEGNRRRGIFRCPPLEAGGEYRLRFNVKTKGIFIERPVDGYSIVLERKTETRTFFGSRSNYEAVYTQVIPPWPQ